MAKKIYPIIFPIAAAIAFLSIFPFGSDFYKFSRIALTLCSIVAILWLFQKSLFQKKAWIGIIPFALGAWLYNPIWPVYLGAKEPWMIINALTALAFLAFTWLYKTELSDASKFRAQNKHRHINIFSQGNMKNHQMLSNFLPVWLTPTHSLFFMKQYWYRFLYREFFDNIEKFPLTLKQRQSIIVDEKRNLIIAGAGTGKTSTIVGKVGFLIKYKKVEPEDILVIAYNRNAAKELKDRIKDKVNIGTFHSIGKDILRQSGHPNRPHEFVDQEEKLLAFLNTILQQCLKQEDFTELYLEYFKKYEFQNIDEVRYFETMGQYANWLRSNKLITLNNEKVKSHGELLIANFLYSNGIDYSYEAYYSSENAIPIDFDYRPDFYLPQYKIYIEYFGIDENGNTADFVPEQKYHEDMKLKFSTHNKCNTKLISLYFYQKKEDKLLSSLEKELKKCRVAFNPIAPNELFKVINNTDKDQRFLKLIEQFLSQYKERQNFIDLGTLRNRAGKDKRTYLFLKIFEILLNAYQKELAKDKRIDFGDMISKSANLISYDPELSSYKYIIIDEFQDISDGRYDLIAQLLKQNDNTKLFCVGDDWQAIYNFSGSDHKIMTSFEERFSKSTILKLDQAFRYNDKIASVSEKFITKNPSQIDKNIKTSSSKETPQIFIHWHPYNLHKAVQEAIKIIQKEYSINDDTLLILSRYNRNKFDGKLLREMKELWKGGTITQKTVHSAKGLEADFVIVADLKSDHHGFPSEILGDPILNLVLPNQDNFADSEERRLFYVALTRAKKQTHLICDSTCPSRFAQELAKEEYAVTTTGNVDAGKKCPACTDGVIIKKRGADGEFYSCQNYPVCKFKPFKCPVCNSDIVLREKTEQGYDVAICQSEDCREVQPQCPDCSDGILIKRTGDYGAFYSCHNYPACNFRPLFCPECKNDMVLREKTAKGYDVAICQSEDCREVQSQCPACSDGILIKRTGDYREFYSCHKFPVCEFKPLECPVCNSDIVLREKTKKGYDVAICQSEDCREVQEHCKRCNVGVYTPREGKKGPFLACHDFPRTKCKGKKTTPQRRLQKN